MISNRCEVSEPLSGLGCDGHLLACLGLFLSGVLGRPSGSHIIYHQIADTFQSERDCINNYTCNNRFNQVGPDKLPLYMLGCYIWFLWKITMCPVAGYFLIGISASCSGPSNPFTKLGQPSSEQGGFSLLPFTQGFYIRWRSWEDMTSHRFITPKDKVRQYKV